MALPTRGQHDWDDELNNEIQRLDSDVQSAVADAVSAKADAAYAKSKSDEAVASVGSVAAAAVTQAETAATNAAASKAGADNAQVAAEAARDAASGSASAAASSASAAAASAAAAAVPTDTRIANLVGDSTSSTAAALNAAYARKAAPALNGWFADAAQARSKRVNVLVCGDSIYEGQDQTSTAVRFPNRVQDLLRARYNAPTVTGGEFVPAQYYSGPAAGGSFPAFTFAGTTANYPQGIGLKGKQLALGTTATITRTCTSVDIYMRRQFSAGTTVEITVDGVVKPTWTLSNITHNKWSSGNLGAGSHTIVIKPLTGSTAPVLTGAYFYNGDETTGLSVWDGSRGGARADSWAASTDWIEHAALVGNFSLAVFGWLPNDARTSAGGYPAATYETHVRTCITNLRASFPNVPVLLMPPYEAIDTLIEPWGNYLARLATIAADTPHVEFFDMRDHIPYLGSDPLGITNASVGDPIHATDKGAALLANIAVGSAMTPR